MQWFQHVLIFHKITHFTPSNACCKIQARWVLNLAYYTLSPAEFFCTLIKIGGVNYKLNYFHGNQMAVSNSTTNEEIFRSIYRKDLKYRKKEQNVFPGTNICWLTHTERHFKSLHNDFGGSNDGTMLHQRLKLLMCKWPQLSQYVSPYFTKKDAIV